MINEALTQQVTATLMPLAKLDSHSSLISKLHYDYNKMHDDMTYKGFKNSLVYLFFILCSMGLAFFTFLLLAIIYYFLPASLHTGVIAIATVIISFLSIFFYINLILNIKVKLFKKSYTPKLHQIQQNIEQAEQESCQIYLDNQEILEVLPYDYRYTIAAQYIQQCLRSGRAYTLADAINLYVQQQNFWELNAAINAGFQNQLREIYNQRQILNQIQKNSNKTLRAAQAAQTSSDFAALGMLIR